MKSLSNNGVSTCMAGQENYVYFNLMPRLRRKSRYCQYDYRHEEDGELFSLQGTRLPPIGLKSFWIEKRTLIQ